MAFQEAIVVGMMDGTARAFGRNIREQRLRELISAAGGEIIDYTLVSRFRLPANTAEEKEMLETTRTALAAEVKALQAEMAETLRLMQKDAEQEFFDFDEVTRALQQSRDILATKNKELAAAKK